MLPPIVDPDLQPFAGRDVSTLLAERASARPSHPFLIWEPHEGEAETWTYARFSAAVEGLAAGLMMSLSPGDRLLVHLDNCPEFLLIWFACARAGVVAVTTNPRSAPGELAYFAKHSKARAAVTQPDLVDVLVEAAPDLDWVVVTGGGKGLGPRVSPFSSLTGTDFHAPPKEPDSLAPLCVQYTSGTTARPKGVVLTHANALWAARTNATHEGLREDDVHMVVLPLCHINALGYSVLATLWVGGTVVLQPKFSASRFWDISLRHGCTWASLVPFCVRALAGRERPAHSYRMFGYPVCDPPTDALMGVRSIGWWGMTETISHGIVGSPVEPGVPMTMGTPAPEYRIKVVDEAGNPVGPGETGELLIAGERGLSMFSHYLDDPAATEAAYDDNGYFITGDRVTLRARGHIAFADRAKDMLKVGGENVAASEIEQVIRMTPGVVEVAVVGRPDRLRDEVPVAFVVLAPGADLGPIREAITGDCLHQLASFKQPAEIRFVESLPKATLDKIAKAELRKLLRGEEATAAGG